LPSTDDFLPSKFELNGGSVDTYIPPDLASTLFGIPKQEKGVKPARALPYQLDVHATVSASLHNIVLTFLNTGNATVTFHVRSGNAGEPVRDYTVEPGKQLNGAWDILSSYDLSVYGPNGFVRYFKGSLGSQAAALEVVSGYDTKSRGSIIW